MSCYDISPRNIQIAKAHIEAVQKRLAEGFHTKSDKKSATDSLNRAYDILVDGWIRDVLLSRREPGQQWSVNSKDHKLYYAIPDLHVWKEKHIKMFGEDAAFHIPVKTANDLVALRAAVIAAPLKEKPKTKTQIKYEERAAVAKTCQICERKILAETGLIAHHGYERPRWMPGGQTASCIGARELPFEKSRDVLGKHIRVQKHQLSVMQQLLNDTQDEKRSLSFEYWTGKYDNHDKRITARVVVTRATFDEKIAEAKAVVRFRSELPLSFDWLKTKRVDSIISDIRQQKDYIKMQQGRYNGWKEVV